MTIMAPAGLFLPPINTRMRRLRHVARLRDSPMAFDTHKHYLKSYPGWLVSRVPSCSRIGMEAPAFPAPDKH
jgi:hypothetical protein